MADEKRYTEAEAHRFFAIKFHGSTWDLIDKAERTQEDNERMINFAHTSLTHWGFCGTGLHQQRGEWLLARVHAILGDSELSLKHAGRCLALTDKHKELMEDFDFAFAYESAARANAIAGNRDEADKYIELAKKAGAVIKDKDDQKVFFSDFESGNWGRSK